jgi:dihydroxy-acid dehydratase
MMPGSHNGTRIGACTDCRNNWAKFRAGEIDIESISAINDELAPTVRDKISFESLVTTD